MSDKSQDLKNAELYATLTETVFGQEKALSDVVECLSASEGKAPGNGPRACLILRDCHGYKGATGKTRTAKELSVAILGKEALFISVPTDFNCSDPKVVTLPPAVLTEAKICDDTCTVILPPSLLIIDEVDKATETSLSCILDKVVGPEALTSARIGDKTYKLDLSNVVVVMTSEKKIDRWPSTQVTDVEFDALTHSALLQIAKKEISRINQQLASTRKVEITVEDAVIEKIVSDEEKKNQQVAGAIGYMVSPVREILYVLQTRLVMETLAPLVLRNEGFTGSVHYSLSQDGNGVIALAKSSEPKETVPTVRQKQSLSGKK